MLTVMIVFLFAGTMLFEHFTTLKKQNRKVKIVHICLMAISFVILMLTSFGIKLPSPSMGIETAIKTIFKLQ